MTKQEYQKLVKQKRELMKRIKAIGKEQELASFKTRLAILRRFKAVK